MVMLWYSHGTKAVFQDWTDPENPVEIAYHDRGPVDSTRMQMGGSWSVYWYNGVIVNSEIARGLDIFELKPNPYLTKNEIDAAKTVKFDQLNPQGQPQYNWPATYALARAYVDQLDRAGSFSDDRISTLRQKLHQAENGSSSSQDILTELADELEGEAESTNQTEKVNKLVDTLRSLAS